MTGVLGQKIFDWIRKISFSKSLTSLANDVHYFGSDIPKA